METLTINKETTATDFLPLNGTDHVEFYVGNAKQAAHYYKTAFGFQSLAYAGPETGLRDRVSYVLQQGKIRLVLTTPLHSDGAINDHIKKHGDGIKILALGVLDAYEAYAVAIERGATSYLEPTTKKDDAGEVKLSGVYTYGETVHLFVERANYTGFFMPGFREWNPIYQPGSTGL